jgi:membrane protein YdbS with pleckstrin-like domain
MTSGAPAYVGGVGLAVIVVVILGVLAGSWVPALVIAAAIAGLTLVTGYLRRVSTKYLITNQRLRISRGVVRRNVQETRLERVQNVNYQQSVLDRMLGVGTVDFDTAGTDDSEFRFDWVDGPEQVVRAVDSAVEQARALGPGAAAGPSPGSPLSAVKVWCAAGPDARSSHKRLRARAGRPDRVASRDRPSERP